MAGDNNMKIILKRKTKSFAALAQPQQALAATGSIVGVIKRKPGSSIGAQASQSLPRITGGMSATTNIKPTGGMNTPYDK